MVSVCEIVHRFVLFVNNADAGLVRPADDRFDILSGFTYVLELFMNYFGSFDGCLRVKLG